MKSWNCSEAEIEQSCFFVAPFLFVDLEAVSVALEI